MNVNKMAAEDAAKWARAEMFFGEGAGTRRKLLDAEITQKMNSIPGYSAAFDKAYYKQDMSDHAIKAAKERQRIDRSKAVKRNVRGLTTGNRQSLTTGVGIAAAAWYVARETGYDEKIKREVKARYYRAKFEVKKAKAKFDAKRAARKSNLHVVD